MKPLMLASSIALSANDQYDESSHIDPTWFVHEQLAASIWVEPVWMMSMRVIRPSGKNVNEERPCGLLVHCASDACHSIATFATPGPGIICDTVTASTDEPVSTLASEEITVAGESLREISPEQWRECFAGAFQDFFRFEFPARHTVGLGDVPRLDDRVAVGAAVGRAGADDVVDRLASGLDTQLGPSWHQGVELSFGQWQKLALARGFMRDEPLMLVLDEPTAALDAETEHGLFERYSSAAREAARDGRITILVSHRFSTVRMADLIVVMDGAHVVEVGTHEQLMARRGQYAELYGIQAAAYR